MSKSYSGRFERVLLKLEYRQHQVFAEGTGNEFDFLRHATRLWNWIDTQRDCERLWRTMAKRLPMSFVNPDNVNSMRFTYGKPRILIVQLSTYAPPETVEVLADKGRSLKLRNCYNGAICFAPKSGLKPRKPDVPTYEDEYVLAPWYRAKLNRYEERVFGAAE